MGYYQNENIVANIIRNMTKMFHQYAHTPTTLIQRLPRTPMWSLLRYQVWPLWEFASIVPEFNEPCRWHQKHLCIYSLIQLGSTTLGGRLW